jgi:hypothetical protein
MTLLNLTPASTPPERPATIAAQLGQIAMKGGAWIGGGSAVLGIVELLKSMPDRGVGLLLAWGPWFFLAGGFLYVLQSIAIAAIRARQQSDQLMSNAIDRMSAQQERLATAAEAAASRDDRQIEQMQILVSTVVMQTKRVLRRLHGQDRALERLEDKLGINRQPEPDADEETDEQ